MSIKHAFTSLVADAGTPGEIEPSHWNSDHTIDAGTVTLAMIANISTSRILGRVTAASGVVEELTAGQVKTLLAITEGDVAGLSGDLTAIAVSLATKANTSTLAAIAFSGSASDLSGGTIPAARMPAFTGDVTTAGGAVATTISASAVTNAKLANMGASTIKGNNTGGSAAPSDLTAAQVKTLLAIAASDVSGLATIATSGSASDLGSGTVPAARMPALTGDVTTSAGAVATTITAKAVTYAKIQDIAATQRVLGRNTAGAGATEEVTASQLFDWISNTNGVLLTRTGGTWAPVGNVTTDNGDLQFSDSAAVAPSGTQTKIFGSNSGGRPMPAGLNALGAKMLMQPFLGQQHPFAWITGLNNAITAQLGMITPTATGTATGRGIATTNSFTLSRRIGYVSAAGAGSVGGLRCATAFLTRQQGFHVVYRFGISDAAITTTGRMFVGIQAATGAPTDVDPSGLVNLIGIGCDANDTVLQLYSAGAAAQARASLGANFPANTTNVDLYELALYGIPGGNITYQVTRINTGDVATGTISAAANLPATTTLLTPQIWRTNGTTAAAVGIDLIGLWGDTDT